VANKQLDNLCKCHTLDQAYQAQEYIHRHSKTVLVSKDHFTGI